MPIGDGYEREGMTIGIQELIGEGYGVRRKGKCVWHHFPGT